LNGRQEGTLCALNGKNVSTIIFGVMRLAQAPAPDLLLDTAFGLGCNCFDLAHVYGEKNESAFGRWLQSRKGLIEREDLFLIAKGGHPAPKSDVPRLQLEQLRSDIQESMQRVRTDYFDLFLLHRDDPTSMSIEEIVTNMNILVTEGSIASWGVSNWSFERTAAAIAFALERGLVPPIASSNQFSLLVPAVPVWPQTTHFSPQELHSWRKAPQRLASLAWAPLAEGCLWNEKTGLKPCWNSSENKPRMERASKLARLLNVPKAALLSAFALQFVDAVVVGTTTAQHFEEIILAWRTKRLMSPEIISYLTDNS
jgi:aryl-alcohol dehydrogenase-like predicted oxidoreductase